MQDRFDFIGKSKLFFGISIGIMAAILAAVLFINVQLDIVFKGGMILGYSYEGEMNFDNFKGSVELLTGLEASVQENKEMVTGETALTVTMAGSLESQKMTELNDALLAEYSGNNLQNLSINNVNPTMGGEFLAKSITAVAFASVLMMGYVAWRFRKIGGISAGAMAVVALIHDVVVVFGAFVIFRFPIDDNFIAVVLTILGYSLNDTIVIYDRIRENSEVMSPKTPISTLVNRSVNQSLTRTIFTAVSTIIAMIVVTVASYVFNVESIRSFALPMVVGLISGTYSTVFIAGPLWVKWQEYRGAKTA